MKTTNNPVAGLYSISLTVPQMIAIWRALDDHDSIDPATDVAFDIVADALDEIMPGWDDGRGE